MGNKETLTRYVRLLTEALLQAGVTDVVMSPGSRSTPLAYAFASSEKMTMYRQIDERSGGYFALGLAKASQKPVVLLCTSGTAASNYLPAITEAYYARIPLVVLTADRPHELREVGAPQTVDQIRMYGKHVKHSVDFPLPEDHAEVEQFIQTNMRRALSIGLTAPRGPVHLNIPFREPLLIDLEKVTPKAALKKYFTSEEVLSEETKIEFQQVIEQTEKGLLVIGELPADTNLAAIWTFAENLQWPVIADPLSNMRANIPKQCLPLCIENYDALLKEATFSEQVYPDTVIRLGAQPVSKFLSIFLKKAAPLTVIAVDESPQFRDSLNIVTHHIQGTPKILPQIPAYSRKSYADKWIEANVQANRMKLQFLETADDEGACVAKLLDVIPSGSDLMSSSSMPIRDVDTFFNATERDIVIFANRGANGIDGVVSTSLGMQATRKRPAWLLIGDLAFLHDVNGLIASRFHSFDLTIVIMNNDGGGIFSYLPQASTPKHFEELFGTPTGVTFDHIAAMYDAQYGAVHSMEQFEMELQKEKVKPIRIIEVFTNREQNVISHRKLWSEIAKGIETGE